MAFMAVAAQHDTWATIDTRNGTVVVPADCVDREACEAGDYESCEDYIEGDVDEVNGVEFAVGWGARLSAAGYMDCTSWDAPHATEELARTAVRELYECDDNGDSDDESDAAEV